MKKIISHFLIFLTIVVSNCFAQNLSDSHLPAYKPGNVVFDELTSVGSDAMGDLVNLWVEDFKNFQPKANFKISSFGSSTAAAALIDGEADLGPMSREMKANEKKGFMEKYGFEPTEIKTSIAALGVYVEKTNPLNEISFSELDAIFSKDKKRSNESITKWNEIKSTNGKIDSSIVPIMQVGKDYLSSFFRQQVMLQGEFKENILSTTDVTSLFETMASYTGVIGIGEVTAKVPQGLKLIAVTKSNSKSNKLEAVLPSERRILAGDYPLSRYLNIYFVKSPGEAMEPGLKEFFNYVLSKEGQAVVRQAGLVPLPVALVKEERAKLK